MGDQQVSIAPDRDQALAPARGVQHYAASLPTASLKRNRPKGESGRSSLGLAARLDYPLIAIVATLLALGLAMVFSASFWQAETRLDLPATYFLFRQALWVVVGIVAMVVMAAIPHWRWQQLAVPILAAILLALLLVLVIGESRLGATRHLAGGSIQPSEIAKLVIVIYAAAWVTSKKDKLDEMRRGLVPFGVLMGMVAGLIALEHSFSVTIIVLIIGFAIFFVGGGDLKQLLIVALIGGGVLALLIWVSPHSNLRLREWWTTVLDPTQVSGDAAKIREMLQRGIGIGTNMSNWVQKAGVPLLWSDYLFANVGADLGFPGTLGVVALFAALGYRCLGIALNAPDRFAGLTAVGITIWILVQAAIHMGASLALIPPTGVPLPFMSYGGSALVSCMAGIGLLLSISRASPNKKAPYADFAFGWRNRRSRLPDSGRGQRTAANEQRRPADHSGGSRTPPVGDEPRHGARGAAEPARRSEGQRAGSSGAGKRPRAAIRGRDRGD